MPSKTALVCAHNPKNPGMYSVDIAGKHFLSSRLGQGNLFLTEEITRAGEPKPLRRIAKHFSRVGDLRFRRLRSPSDLRGYDRVVYWGDFQNNPAWGASDFAERQVRRGLFPTIAAAFDFWSSLYLKLGRSLPDSTELYSIGGCFMGMGPYLRESGIMGSFEYFLDRTKGIIVRDTASFKILKSTFPSRLTENVHLGYDVAALVPVEQSSVRPVAPYFIYSFGRSDVLTSESERLVRRLEAVLGMEAIELSWLDPPLPLGSQLFFRAAFRNLSRLISGASLVITDIYHLSINSLSLGIPVICLYKRDRLQEGFGTLGDEKKKVLFDMLQGTDFIFNVEDGGVNADKVDQICGCATRVRSTPGYANKLLVEHERLARSLMATIEDVVGL